MGHQRPSAILPKYAGLRDRRAGPLATPTTTHRSLEHPRRDLKKSTRRRTRKAAAENMRPFGHRLMHVNEPPRPGMPRIQKLANLGLVGVLSSCCTTETDRTRRWAISPPANSQ
nr:hypothetical protein - Rhizobium leguminosarum plasmid pRL7JI [Rhizobium leguminosarum]